MLLKEGAAVTFYGRTEESVRRVRAEFAPEHKVLAVTADVRSGEAVERMFHAVVDRFGGLDTLINYAGIGRFECAADLSVEDWEQVIETNLGGVFRCCRAAILLFRARGGSETPNISSLAARTAFAGGAADSASKFGLHGFTEALRLDDREDRVQLGLIAPGSVDTEFSPRRNSPAAAPKPEEVAVKGLKARAANPTETAAEAPAKRMETAAEAAETAAKRMETLAEEVAMTARHQAGAGVTDPGGAKAAPEAASGHAWKIALEDVAEVARARLRMPARSMISLAEIRPSRPLQT